MFTRDYGIIVACDVDSLGSLVSLIRSSHDQKAVVAFKVGFSLALRFGLKKVIETIQTLTPLPVIYDHQKAGTDIPQMADPFARCCSDCGIRGVIIFPQAGPETMRAFISATSRYGMLPIVGGMMTHSHYLSSDGGFIVDEAPSIIYRDALDQGVTAFVLPGNKPEYVRKYTAEMMSNKISRLFVLMPGIGSQGGDIKSAFNAAPEACCYAIVGSAIYNSSDPQKVLANYAEQIEAYYKEI